MKMRELFEDEVPSALDRWFAGSKIMDHNDRPLKLYHGTSKDMDFKSFRMPKNGVWFTTDPMEASSYAEENDSKDLKYIDGKFVGVNNAQRVIPCYLRATSPLYINNWPDEFNVDNYRRAQGIYFDKLRAQGHDAVVFRNKIYVAIGSPTQIKSAIGNVKFDGTKKGLHEEVKAFHGSQQSGGPVFQLGHSGDNSHTIGSYQSKRWGVFFTNNPDFARLYGTVNQYTLNVNNTIDFEIDHGDTFREFLETLDPFGDERQLWLAAKHLRHDWQMFENEVGERFVAFLKERGYDSAAFVEYNEDENGEEHRSETIVVFDPAKIKKINLSEAEMVTELSVPATLKDATKRLAASGYKCIGGGSFGDVFYKSGSDYVLKLFTNNDRAYIAFVKLAVANPNKYFPKFYSSLIRVNDKYSAIRMEYLEPLKGDFWYDIKEYILYGKDETEEFMYDEELSTACNLIRGLLDDGVGLDMKENNVMRRGNTPVITDPVVGDGEVDGVKPPPEPIGPRAPRTIQKRPRPEPPQTKAQKVKKPWPWEVDDDALMKELLGDSQEKHA